MNNQGYKIVAGVEGRKLTQARITYDRQGKKRSPWTPTSRFGVVVVWSSFRTGEGWPIMIVAGFPVN